MQGTSKAFSVELKHFYREDSTGSHCRSTSFIVAFDLFTPLPRECLITVYQLLSNTFQTRILKVMFFTAIVTEAPVYHPMKRLSLTSRVSTSTTS
jgi:hypothetical protein